MVRQGTILKIKNCSHKPRNLALIGKLSANLKSPVS